MSTASPPPPRVELVTAEQYAERHDLSDVPTELVRGEIVEMVRPNPRHGVCCFEVGRLLGAWAGEDGDVLRVMTNDTGFVTERGPDTVRGPDVMAIRKSRLPGGKLTRDWFETIAPDVCVEVRSPSNSWREMTEKTAEYLTAGVPLVWVVDPEARTVHVFQPDAPPENIAEDGRLLGYDVLPGLAAHVADLFESI